MTQNYGRVLITCIFDKVETGLSQIPVYTEEEYMKQHAIKDKKQGGLCELVGLKEYQVKPYFDLDPKGEDFDYSKFDDFEIDLKRIYKDLTGKEAVINVSNRNPREEKGTRGEKIIKHSRRYYLKARISYDNIIKLFKEVFEKYPFVDNSVYKPNQRMFAPLSTKKLNLVVPQLKVIKGSIFGNCATYIEEDYEDLDLKVKIPEEIIKFNNILCDDNEPAYEGNLNFNEIITKLSKNRATDYPNWFPVIVAFINLYYRKIISRGQVYDLADLFSSKADNYDPNGVVKVIDNNINRFDGKGYGVKYLMDCLRFDNIEYYKTITKKELLIDGANDDIGASEIVVNHYKDILIICQGVLYVKHNDIWTSNREEVNKLLINLIGKLDILFYGADGKRKYHYNKGLKHIKDCIICITANKTIVNDNFYDDMINNNKYYLPFNDGIYSFKDKKLYKYNELPNIHFTYKINRNFPIANKNDYDELMEKVIIPIYPNEDERNYNAHIKARALAGCYVDKKWYGYSGSRNSGKGVETKILKSGFGNFVMEFNAKCLILSKFTNPDVAKALNWVVDKKDARIIISNEIDGDENTVLNGAFIKTLASGGDAMEGRRLYENSVSFIPQFTMFLCYNHFYKVEPADATENLEQFEYKSKFVSEEDLIDGCPYLKLKDDNIKEFIKQERIIDAYTLYILNAFTDPRMKTPENVKISTETNNWEQQVPIETFIIKNFITTNDSKDRLHTETICEILIDNSYKINIVEAGKLINRIGIGKYNKKCNINTCRKRGYDYIKFIGIKDEV